MAPNSLDLAKNIDYSGSYMTDSDIIKRAAELKALARVERQRAFDRARYAAKKAARLEKQAAEAAATEGQGLS